VDIDFTVKLLHWTTDLRTYMMDILTDQDLQARIAGNPSLGELCREHGNVERDYLESFKTFAHRPAAEREQSAELAASVEKLKAWYKALDAEFEAALRAIPQSTYDSLMIARGSRPLPAEAHFYTYREAMLIFCAQCSIYLRMLGKPLNAQWEDWIG
jgi:hypothetical protein